MIAPIVLFAYNRPKHTEAVLLALSKNDLLSESRLIVYLDGPAENATTDDLEKINAVREVVFSRKWAKWIEFNKSEQNKGLANSIISGVTEITKRFGKAIILEDDIVVSPGFLQFMNEALDLYELDDHVMSVAAFMYPIMQHGLPETFFYSANSCWGWATWEKKWQKFENNAEYLHSRLVDNKVDWTLFNAFQGNAFKEQLENNISGELNTWAVKWHASIILNRGTVLHPRKSLTRNIGFDGSGTHCGLDPELANMQVATAIEVKRHNRLRNDPDVQVALREYFGRKYSTRKSKLIIRIKRKLAAWLQ